MKKVLIHISILVFGLIVILIVALRVPVAANDIAVWTDQTNAGAKNWIQITSSSDGTKLAAIELTGYIYTSSDSGATWTQQTGAGSQGWTSIASSADGMKLAVAASSGDIYTSIDGGATWVDQTGSGSRSWREITSSADGTKLAANITTGQIYTSVDSGVTWTLQPGSPLKGWTTLVSSADGTKLIAASNSSTVYISLDSGVTWTAQTNLGNNQAWYGVTVSADGSTFAAAAFGLNIFAGGGDIFTSIDNGTTWIDNTGSGLRSWDAITISADGKRIAASVHNGDIYTSNDRGVTWTDQTGAGSRTWNSITSSADGTKLIAAAYNNGDIYTTTLYAAQPAPLPPPPSDIAPLSGISSGGGGSVSNTNASIPPVSNSIPGNSNQPLNEHPIQLTQNNFKGNTNSEVKSIQQYLNEHGFIVATQGIGSPGNEGTYYGIQTKIAVAKFQLANNIKPVDGYVGPITRAFMMSH